MTTSKQRKIISIIDKAIDHLKYLQWAIEENKKQPDDLMDYVNETERQLIEIESLLYNNHP